MTTNSVPVDQLDVACLTYLRIFLGPRALCHCGLQLRCRGLRRWRRQEASRPQVPLGRRRRRERRSLRLRDAPKLLDEVNQLGKQKWVPET